MQDKSGCQYGGCFDFIYKGENIMLKKVLWIILVTVCGMILGMLSPTK